MGYWCWMAHGRLGQERVAGWKTTQSSDARQSSISNRHVMARRLGKQNCNGNGRNR